SPIPTPGPEVRTIYRESGANYFSTMLIAFLTGREFTERDNAANTPLAIINETLATSSWPNESPIGKRLTLDVRHPHWLTIVGVIKDVKQGSWASPPDNEVYIPFLQDPQFLGSTH